MFQLVCFTFLRRRKRKSRLVVMQLPLLLDGNEE